MLYTGQFEGRSYLEVLMDYVLGCLTDRNTEAGQPVPLVEKGYALLILVNIIQSCYGAWWGGVVWMVMLGDVGQ